MPEESKATQPAAAPPALSGADGPLPLRFFLLLFWSTWLRERLLVLLPALAALCFGLSAFVRVFALFGLSEDGDGNGFHWHYMLPFVPRSTRLAVGLNAVLEYAWPALLFVVAVLLVLPTVLRWQLRSHVPAEALPDLTCLRLWDRPGYALASVALLIAVGLFLLHAFLGPLMIDID